MKTLKIMSLGLLALATTALVANAWHVDGYVRCPNGTVFKGVTVKVTGTSTCNAAFADSAQTDGNGYYMIYLPDCPGEFTVTLDAATLPADASVLTPVGGTASVVTTDSKYSETVNWDLDTISCATAVCWFTGGGAKMDALLSLKAATRESKVNGRNTDQAFGGNVYPGCNPTSGQGGNWNHVDRISNLHFKGTAIQVVDCGNVTPPPPPGSTSPVTPYNYIEFVGTGTLKGIKGNKADYGTVYFRARCEDRNEPGSRGATEGSLVDRYYLRVYDLAGNTLLLVSEDPSNPTSVAPTPITTGNFQLHISSCDNPPGN
jgi:hypothetical protein